MPASRRAGKVTFGVLNFKSIASAQLEPRRLTVIAGSNSSGKSSLLQALLFCAQSFGEPTPVINGDLVRLGEANDVIRDGMDQVTLEFAYTDVSREGPTQRAIELPRSLRLTLNPRDQGRSLAAYELSLWDDDDFLFKAAAANPPKDFPCGEDEQTLQIVDPGNFNLPPQSYVVVAGITPTRLVYEANEAELESDFREMLDTGRGQHLPFEELVRLARNSVSDEAESNRLGEIANQIAHGDMRQLSDPDRQLFLEAFREVVAPSGWVSEQIAPVPRHRAFWRVVGADGQNSNDAAFLAREIGRGLDQVDRLAAAVLYLGPLRDDPRVAYPLGHTVRALPVGEKGEFTAAYLRENRAARLSFGRPDGTQAPGLLTTAVNQWCEYLGIADRIEVSTQGKLGHVLGLRVGGQNRDPTAIGVGASQLLPVVVLVLGAPEGSVVLLEQPELHLHPGVQSRLADFLAYARRNIRIVVETHSEYLLTRLRLRVAEGSLEPSELAVLFATQQSNAEGDEPASLHTEFEHLSLDELGDFNRWPEDFFDSLDHDSVDLAQAVARKLKDTQSPNG